MKKSVRDWARLPSNDELFASRSQLLRHYLMNEVCVTQSPFFLYENGEVDAERTAADFVKVKELAIFDAELEYACHTEPAPGSAPHPALSNIGGAKFYGGAGRSWDPAATLIGLIWFGTNTKVRVSAKITGPTLIDDETYINTAAKITRSVIGQKCQIEEDVTIKDAIIGSRVFIGAGARLTSRCEDDPWHTQEVITRWTDQGHFDRGLTTGRRKLGPIVGDDCRIGANAVLKPGVILFPGCKVPAGRVVPAGIYLDTSSVNKMLSPLAQRTRAPRYC